MWVIDEVLILNWKVFHETEFAYPGSPVPGNDLPIDHQYLLL